MGVTISHCELTPLIVFGFVFLNHHPAHFTITKLKQFQKKLNYWNVLNVDLFLSLNNMYIKS